MNTAVENLNLWGAQLAGPAGAMLWQSTLLGLVILLLDFGLRPRSAPVPGRSNGRLEGDNGISPGSSADKTGCDRDGRTPGFANGRESVGADHFIQSEVAAPEDGRAPGAASPRSGWRERFQLRASVRYGLWLVLLVKLVLPPSLALPTGAAWWWSSATQLPPVSAPAPAPRHWTTTVIVSPQEAPKPEDWTAPEAVPEPAPPPRPALTPAAWGLLAAGVVSLGLLGWVLRRWRLVVRTARRAENDPAFGELLAEACRLAGRKAESGKRKAEISAAILLPLGGTAPGQGNIRPHPGPLPQERGNDPQSHRKTTVPVAGRQPAANLAAPGDGRGPGGLRVKVTRETVSPAVCGLFRPVILLPQALTETLSPEQLRAVLLHELMHVRRGDVWVNCAQALLQIVYWWHPLVWVANARLRRLREEAVDDAVVAALREDAEVYAPTLLAVAKFAFHRPLASLGLVGILESRSALRQRIERLVNFPPPRKAGLGLVSAFGLLVFSAVAVPMGDAPPLPPAPDSQPAATNNAGGTGAVAPQESKTDEPNGSTNGQAGSLSHLAADAAGTSGYVPPGHNPYDQPGLVYTGPGRHEIVDKLFHIHLGRVDFDRLPLTEVLKNLSAQVKALDPKQTGINFVINPNPNLSAGPAAAAQLDADSVLISLHLSEVDLVDVMDALVLLADHPIQYSVQDYGIVFSARAAGAEALTMRNFKVNGDVFNQGLESVGSAGFGVGGNGNGSGLGGGGNSGGNGGGTAVPVVNMTPGAGAIRSSFGGAGAGGNLGGPADYQNQAAPPPTTPAATAGGQAGSLSHASDPGVGQASLPDGRAAGASSPAQMGMTGGKPPMPADKKLSAVEDASNQAVLRQAEIVSLRQKLVAAVSAEHAGQTVGAAKLYQEAADLTEQIGAGIDPETALTVAGLARTRLALAREAQTHRDFDEAARQIALVLKYDPKNPGALVLKQENDTLIQLYNPKKPEAATPADPPTTNAPLVERTFRVDAIKIQNLITDMRLPDQQPLSLKIVNYFHTLGINLNEKGKTVFYGDRLGLLTIRATEDELDKIGLALDALNNPAATHGEPLFERVIPVDMHTFIRDLEGVTSAPFVTSSSQSGGGGNFGNSGGGSVDRLVVKHGADVLNDLVKNFFTTKGINLNAPGRAVFFNDRRGLLNVRATRDELDEIEQILKTMTATNGQAGSLSHPAADTLVQNGKLFYEMGKLDEAETNLQQAAQLDTNNTAAIYYLQLVQQERIQRSATNQVSATRTNLNFTGSGRQRIADQLKRIRLDSFTCDHVTLSEALNNLASQSKKLHPEEKEIHFLIFPGVNPGDNLQSNPVQDTTIKLNLTNVSLAEVLDAMVKGADHPIKYSIMDYGVAFFVKATNSVPLFDRTFRVEATVVKKMLDATGTNFLTEEQIDAMARPGPGTMEPGSGPRLTDEAWRESIKRGVTGQKVKNYFTTLGINFNEPGETIFYNDGLGLLTVRATQADMDKVEQALGALNNLAATNGEPLFDRTFRVDMSAFIQGLERLSSGGGGVHFIHRESLTQLVMDDFVALGIRLNTTGKTVFFNDRLGLLTVRATQDDLDKIEQILDTVDGHQAMLHIKARFYAITSELGNIPTLTNHWEGQTLVGIMAPEPAGTFLHGLEARPGTEDLGEPEVTTVSGRPAQVRETTPFALAAIDRKALPPSGVAGLDPAKFTSILRDIGPVFDVAPLVLSDGDTIDLMFLAGVDDFAGYDQPTDPDTVYLEPQTRMPVWSARLVQHQFSQTVNLYDGQTLVVYDGRPYYGQPLPATPKRNPRTGQPIESEAGNQKHLLMLVTATIVDPAGNRVHQENELPFARDRVPAQPEMTGTNGQAGSLSHPVIENDGGAAKSGALLPQSHPNAPTNLIYTYTDSGRSKMERKLNRIHLDSVSYDRLPLSEVLRLLAKSAHDGDPDHIGVNFILNPNPNLSDPAATATAQDAGKFLVSLKLTDVSLAEVLDALVFVAKPPPELPPDYQIKYSMVDYGVIFSFISKNSEPLYDRTFKLEATTVQNMITSLRIPIPENASQLLMITNCFHSMGIHLDQPGKTILYNDRLGLLTVRATQVDLDAIGRALDVFSNLGATNGVSVPATNGAGATFHIGNNVPYVTGTYHGGGYSGGGSANYTVVPIPAIDLSGDAGANLLQPTLGLTSATIGQAGSLSHLGGTNPGVIANPDFQAAIHALQQRSGTEVLGEPEVTTSSGQWDPGKNRIGNQPISLPVSQPMLHIKARFIEVEQDDNKAPGSGWYLGPVTNAVVTPGDVAPLRAAVAGGTGDRPAAADSGPARAALTGILSRTNFQTVLRALENRPGAEILGEPEVTTLSGRQTQMRATQRQTVLTGINPKALTPPGIPRDENEADGKAVMVSDTNSLMTWTNREFGPVFDVLPRVLADGVTIQLEIKASADVFAGYDKTGKPVPIYIEDSFNGLPVPVQAPHPRIIERALQARVNLYDGQTVVLGTVPEARAGEKPKLLLVLATVTIVDPAGNRVHTDEELPSHGGETPVQTPEDRDRNLEILQRMFGGHNSQHLDDRPFDQEQRRGP